MARPKKYEDAVKLERKINRYFASISRERVVTEPVPTGELDEYGHMKFKDTPVINQLGQEIMTVEFLVPPTVGGLCAFLGIDRSTWALYGDPEKHPEFFDTISRARGRIQAWNEEQLLTRKGADIKGIVFNLENNYGYAQKTQIDMTGGLEQYIRQTEDDGERGGF